MTRKNAGRLAAIGNILVTGGSAERCHTSRTAVPSARSRPSARVALAALRELSLGVLREIDRLATAALREAARRKKLCDREIVTRVGEAFARFD